mmetsp:Transcript_17509/g.54687  ORF Transcript_17509/g.54687 Transcript_17509/m.54687 type:complete len:208 (-) Transcript_17509:675-1298(-)
MECDLSCLVLIATTVVLRVNRRLVTTLIRSGGARAGLYFAILATTSIEQRRGRRARERDREIERRTSERASVVSVRPVATTGGCARDGRGDRGRRTKQDKKEKRSSRGRGDDPKQLRGHVRRGAAGSPDRTPPLRVEAEARCFGRHSGGGGLSGEGGLKRLRMSSLRGSSSALSMRSNSTTKRTNRLKSSLTRWSQRRAMMAEKWAW